MPRFRYIRYLVLLLMLFAAAGHTLYTRARAADWDGGLRVVVIPVDADRRPATARYLASLTDADVAPIGAFLNAEAQLYGVGDATLVEVSLGPALDVAPPQLGAGRGVLDSIFWSLAFRFWSARQLWQRDIDGGDVTLYVQYYDPAVSKRLAHSLGLRKGMIGLVNAFADDRYRGSNNVVIAHELLHTLGASDKYDPRDNRPLYPEGYAHPEKKPLYPQRRAELMAGRIPLSAWRLEMPKGFDQVTVGAWTAAEIGWLSAARARR